MPGKNNQLVEKTKAAAKTILLVEDDAVVTQLLIQMITQETPHQIFSVPDAPEALDLVKYIKPELLILDYWLPTIHGIELYDRLHTSEGLEKVPTIMLSVNAPLKEIKQRQIFFIRKPFDMFKLLQAIDNLLDE
jgi:DNA-binding NtrC family response regulator